MKKLILSLLAVLSLFTLDSNYVHAETESNIIEVPFEFESVTKTFNYDDYSITVRGTFPATAEECVVFERLSEEAIPRFNELATDWDGSSYKNSIIPDNEVNLDYLFYFDIVTDYFTYSELDSSTQLITPSGITYTKNNLTSYTVQFNETFVKPSYANRTHHRHFFYDKDCNVTDFNHGYFIQSGVTRYFKTQSLVPGNYIGYEDDWYSVQAGTASNNSCVTLYVNDDLGYVDIQHGGTGTGCIGTLAYNSYVSSWHSHMLTVDDVTPLRLYSEEGRFKVIEAGTFSDLVFSEVNLCAPLTTFSGAFDNCTINVLNIKGTSEDLVELIGTEFETSIVNDVNLTYCDVQSSDAFGTISDSVSLTNSVVSNDSSFRNLDVDSVYIDNCTLHDHCFYDSIIGDLLVENITGIPEGIFQLCTLDNVRLNNVNTIGTSSFSDTTINSIEFGDTLTSIGDNAFANSELYCDLILPDTLLTIGNSAFSSCYSTQDYYSWNQDFYKVHFGTGLQSIGDSAFMLCNALNVIEVNSPFTCNFSSAFYTPVFVLTFINDTYHDSMEWYNASRGFGVYNLNSQCTYSDGTKNLSVRFELAEPIVIQNNQTSQERHGYAVNMYIEVANENVVDVSTGSFPSHAVTLPSPQREIGWMFNCNSNSNDDTFFFYLKDFVIEDGVKALTQGFFGNPNDTSSQFNSLAGASQYMLNNIDAGKWELLNGPMPNEIVHIPDSLTSMNYGFDYMPAYVTTFTGGKNLETIKGSTHLNYDGSGNPLGGMPGSFYWPGSLSNLKKTYIEGTCSETMLNYPWKYIDFRDIEILPVDVTFEPNNGEDRFKQRVPYNSALSVPTDPVLNQHYTFKGWYRTDQVTGVSVFNLTRNSDDSWDFTSDYADAYDITLYAHYTPVDYNVSFSVPDGYNCDDVTVTYNTLCTAPSEPNVPGYTFKGWYKDASYTTVWDFDSDVVTGDTTLYARYDINTYRVVFVDYNNLNQTVEYNTTCTKPEDPVVTGKDFIGWYTDSELSNAFDFTTPITDNIELYPKFNDITFTVTFTGYSDLNQTIIYDGVCIKPEDPVITGKDFKGWYIDTQYTEAFDFSTHILEDVVLYPKFEDITYTVTFIDYTDLNQTVIYNTKCIKPTDPSVVGKDFKGWYLDSTYNQLFDFDTPVLSDITLYPLFTSIKVTLTFDDCTLPCGDAYDVTLEPRVVNYGEDVELPIPPCENHAFDSWYVGNSAIPSTFAFTENTTLVPKFTCKNFRVVFHYNDDVTPDTVREDIHSGTIYNIEPSRDGYTFEGWYLDEGLTLPRESNVITSNSEFWAKWSVSNTTPPNEPNEYKVTLLSGRTPCGEDVTSVPTRELTFTGTPLDLPNITLSHHSFLGWYDNDGEAVTVIESITSDITLTAKWSCTEYRVGFSYTTSDNSGVSATGMNVAFHSGSALSVPKSVKDYFNSKGYDTGDFDWFYDNDLTEPVTFGVPVLSQLSLYASLKDGTEPPINPSVHEVSFIVDDVIEDTVEVEHNSKVLKPKNPVKATYTFEGWYTSKDYKTKWNFNKDTVKKSMYLYAKFIKVKTLDEPDDSDDKGTSSTSTYTPPAKNSSSTNIVKTSTYNIPATGDVLFTALIIAVVLFVSGILVLVVYVVRNFKHNKR